MYSDSPSSRKLAAILFADIVGYTSLMQRDEQEASTLLRRFQKTIEAKVQKHNGRIVNFYGDGALCTFDIPLSAVRCAMELQNIFLSAPEVPVRIGIHSGTVTLERDKIFGDAVNIASRIESMASAGAILLSKKVRNEVKNNPDLELKSLGSFDFKNIEESMEIFALTNEGFPVPKREEMKGKLKDNSGSFFQNIWKKKLPQVLIVYILLAWIGLQLFDWALNQFGISPYWSQIFFIAVIGIIPSLLVYLNNRERIHNSHLKLGEKVLFPSNFALVGVVLFLMFRSADLGAITKNITYINEDGKEETHQIIKTEFKKQFPIFPFEPINKSDSINAWIGLGIHSSIEYFLNQDKYLDVSYILLPRDRAKNGEYFTKVEKLQKSKVYRDDLYVDGRYQYINGKYELIPTIRNKVNGNLVKEKRFISPDLFAVLDSVVTFLRNGVGLTPSQIDESLVLKGSEILVSKNVEALKEFLIGLCLGNESEQWEKAIELDSVWVLPAVALCDIYTWYSSGKVESKLLIDRVVRHMNNLPFQEQIAIRIQKHLIYGEWDKAEKLVKLQLEIEPGNDDFNFMLSDLYLRTGQVEKYISQAEKHYASNPTLRTGSLAAEAALMKGEPHTVINGIEPILERDPNLVWALQLMLQAYIHQGKYDLAEETVDKIILISPDIELNISKSLEAIHYLKTNGHSKESLTKFIGRYRFENSEMYVDHNVIGNHLYTKAENQLGIFLYQAGKKKVVHGYHYKSFNLELIFNDREMVYALKYTETSGTDEWVNYMWKQDSLIWNAESLLRQGKYDEAYKAINAAVAAHPEHYYLKQQLEHLQYLQIHSEEEVQKNLQRVAGDYSGAKFWVEKGLLYYKRPGLARRILRPINDNRFITLSRYMTTYEFVEEDDKVVGIRAYLHDYETGEWNMNPNWYYERTSLKD